MERPHCILIPVLLWNILLCIALFLPSLPISRLYAACIGTALSLLLFFLLFRAMRKEDRRRLDREDAIFAENHRTTTKLIRDVDIPCALIQGDGNIVWRNESFRRQYSGRSILEIIPSYKPENPLAGFMFPYAGSTHIVKSIPVKRESTDSVISFMYWIDHTDAAHYQRLYEERMPYVALVYIDNYEELTSDLQFHRTSALAETERLVAEFSQSLDGIYRRYESGRFIVIFEASKLEQMEADRFSLLEKAHGIDTGTGATVSISIAVGAADRIGLSDEAARQAMDLALGRGGDQAVIKQGADYRFFGGRMQLDAMQSRVKARLFSKALRQLFESSGDIFVMGHKNPDMDCLGAALGVITCAKYLGLRTYFVLDSVNATIETYIGQIASNASYSGLIIPPDQAEKMIRPTSVLVIVDTQRESTLASPALLALTNNIVLIDHHRRSADHIENATLHYLESRASSASELMTEVLQYFDDNLRPSPFVSGALLAGIILDTKQFGFNVSSRTFEAAAYLRRNGADIASVKELFQDNLEEYIDCINAVRTAEILPGGIAITCVAQGVQNAKLIAAKAADELLTIRGIQASFVLGAENGAVNVSGRSLGEINAQLICEKLGGGGHLTMSGAQLGGKDLPEAVEQVKCAIEEYLKEADIA